MSDKFHQKERRRKKREGIKLIAKKDSLNMRGVRTRIDLGGRQRGFTKGGGPKRHNNRVGEGIKAVYISMKACEGGSHHAGGGRGRGG